ncbi:MAG: adenosine deaminase [Firmicutes bacterium]|nr:adenosine deaminase [Bacillota bacterium]
MDLQVNKIPKVEMHLHIEGAIPRNTYIELRRKREPSYSLDQSPWHDDNYRFDSLDHFLNTASPSVTQTAEDYRRIATDLFQNLIDQNIIYTEITVASHRVPYYEIAQAIHNAWEETVPDARLTFGILVGLFRSDNPETAVEMVKQGIRASKFGVVGVDLLAHETIQPASVFKEAFNIAKEAGLGLRSHAGEGAGSESMWDAIRSLGVSRIAHGTRAVEDRDLIKYLIDNNITLDMCPTSNYKLRVVRTIEEHPIRQFFDSGVKVTVSSDDPLFFNSDITNELVRLHKFFNFKTVELLQLSQNAIDSAFLPQNKKNKFHQILVEKYNQLMQS